MLRYAVVLLSFISVALSDTPCCEDEVRTKSQLDTAIDLITKAKSSVPSCSDTQRSEAVRCVQESLDCADLYRNGYNKSGVYNITLVNRLFYKKSVEVYCDMETDGGGWTVIQRRGDFGRDKHYFFKDWNSYKEGFGDLKEDFWWGNDHTYALTNQKFYSARFDMEDIKSHERYAFYDIFWIDDENNMYTLHIANYTGDAGDSMISDGRYDHNNQKFSTYDNDNDNSNETSCAETYKGAWWYNRCQRSNLNGLDYKGKYRGVADGIHWATWTKEKETESWQVANRESLKSTEIKVRPRNFKESDD